MWAAIAAAALALIFLYFKRAHSVWTARGVPQLRPTFPFGDMAAVIFRRQNMGDKIKEIYDWARGKGHRFVGLYFFSRRALLVVDPVLIKHVLAKGEDRAGSVTCCAVAISSVVIVGVHKLAWLILY